MIDFEQARQIAIDQIGPNCGLIEDATFEKPYGWYFASQSIAYLNSGNFRDMIVGSSGFIVEREEGRIFLPMETCLANYEKGFTYERYSLTITAVRNRLQTLYFLEQLQMTFVKPKFAHGVEWKIPQAYSYRHIARKLSSLPAVFENQSFWSYVEVFGKIDRSDCCSYELNEFLVGSLIQVELNGK